MTPRALPASCLVLAAMVLAACTSVRLDQPTPPPSAPRAVDADRYPPPQLRAPPSQPIEPDAAAAARPRRGHHAAATRRSGARCRPAVPSPESPSRRQRLRRRPHPPDPAPTRPFPPHLFPPVLAPPTVAPTPRAPRRSVPRRLPRPLVGPGRCVHGGAERAGAARAARPASGEQFAGAGDRALRIARRDGRLHVVIGDQPDRAGAIRLAALLREALQQDVTLFAW
jgi:hypothetical protein